MRRVMLEVSDELFAAIEAARDGVARNPFIEAQLWNSPAVKRAAKAAGIARPKRRKPGRPTNADRKAESAL